MSAAAERGISVICQKPFCETLAQARRAVEIAEAARIRLIVHENFRFQPWHMAARGLVASGRLGDIYQASFRIRPGDGQGPRAYLDRQPYFQTMTRFLVHETAIHLIDVMRAMLGEVTAVYADLRRLNPAIKGEDAGLIVLEFGSGARGLIDGNRLADHQARDRRYTIGEMLVEGSKGALRLTGDGELRHRAFGSNVEEGVVYPRGPDRGFAGDSVYNTIRAAIDGLAGRAPLVNSGRDYLVNLAIEQAVYESSAGGRRIAIARA
jgi:predicted dehydrogenase